MEVEGGIGGGVICAAGAALAGDDSGFIQIDSGDAAAEKYLSKSIWRRALPMSHPANSGGAVAADEPC